MGGVALALGIATDEPGSSPASRLARLAALLPVIGGLASALVSSQAQSRGEIRALMALGASPLSAVRGALTGAVLVGLSGVLSILSGAADLRSLFPHIPREPAFRLVDGAWLNAAEALRVSRAGDVSFTGEALAPAAGAPPGATFGTALALLVASLSIPAWALRPSSKVRRLAVSVALGMVAVISFHLVAAEQAPPLVLVSAPLLLLVDVAVGGGGLRAAKSPSL